MDDVVESLGRNFERLLRWAYPGALFLVLLRMSRPNAFDAWAQVEHPWGLVVGGLVAGFALYLIQANAINQVITIVVQVLKWDVNVGLQVAMSSASEPRQGLRWLTRLMDRQAQGTIRRWSRTERDGRKGYLDYGWATYHAMLLTGWLTLLFWQLSEDGSTLETAATWKVVLPVTLFVLGSFWTYAQLTRVPLGESSTPPA